MLTTITTLIQDDAGFIVSAELVLVGTVLVLGMLVGMSQVQHAVVQELNDFGHALGSLNQSYLFSGFHARKWSFLGVKSWTPGSFFHDFRDACDVACSIHCAGAMSECGWADYGYGAACGGAACGGTASGGIGCGVEGTACAADAGGTGGLSAPAP